jgi:O-antigen/teichoic acid export membrane protein
MSGLSERVKRASAALPAGTIPIGLGLFVNGVVTFVFLKLAYTAIDDDHERYLTTLWFLIFTLAPGLLLPLEQELGRAISARRHHGEGSLPVVKRAGALGGTMIGVVVLIALALSPFYIDTAFAGSTAMLAVFLLGLPTYALYYLFRGVLSGSHSFASYGWLLAAEGFIRIGLCIIFLIFGATHESFYASTLVLAPLMTLAILARRERGILKPGPVARWAELTNALGWLVIAQVFAQFLMNAAPLAVSLLTHEGTDEERAVATHYGLGFLVARVPLYLFAAVQAALLPKLSRLIAGGFVTEFKAGMRQLYAVIAGVTVVFSFGAYLFGPGVIETLYGPEYVLSSQTFIALGLASGAFMFATAFAQGLIAIAKYRDVAFAWAVGAITFVGTITIGDDVIMRANMAFLAGSTAAAVTGAWRLSVRLKQHVPGPHLELERDDPELVVEL